MNKKIVGIIVLINLIGCTPLLFAADPPIPENIRDEAARVGEKALEEIQEPYYRKVEFPRPEEEKAEALGFPEVPFFVKQIHLEGNTVISAESLRKIIAPYENKEEEFNDIQTLASEIEAEYRTKGYVTTQVYIPPQKVEGGIVLLRIIEGRVGEIKIEGNRFYSSERILSYIKLKPGDILEYEKLRRSVQRVNQNPDRNVQAILKKGATPETTDVYLNIKDVYPLHARIIVDNQGNESIGDERYGVIGQHNNLLGLDDTYSLGVVGGKDFGSIFTQYGLPLPKHDANAVVGFSYTQTAPKNESEPFGVNGISQTYFSRLEKNFVDSDHLVFDAGVGFDVKESRTKVLSGTFRRERLRVINFGPTVLFMDSGGSTRIVNQYSFGIDGLGAAIHVDPDSNRQEIGPDFFVVTGNILRNQRLPNDMKLSAKLDFQLTGNRMPSAEAYYLGGANSVRGYPEGDYLADYGYTANIEFVMPCYFIPADWNLPNSKIPLQKRLELEFFVDFAQGWVNDPGAEEIGSRDLVGIGPGLRVQLYDKVYARVEWGFPLGDRQLSQGGGSFFHFRFQYEV